jgi:ammonium transporter Rh
LAAGLLSEVGCQKVQGFLEKKLRLHDTCGIHNLHGMPSIFGALCSVFLPLMVERGGAGELGKPMDQFLGMVFTLIVAVCSGLLTGGVLSLLKDDAEAFSDESFWEVAKDTPESV